MISLLRQLPSQPLDARGPLCASATIKCYRQTQQVKRRRAIHVRGSSKRSYLSSSSPSLAPYRDTETRILTSSLKHIPSHGFSRQALASGLQDAGFLPASLALFPRGEFELVMFHVITQRLTLKERLPWCDGAEASDEDIKGTAARVRYAILKRLHANTPFAHKYSEAIALMSLASNIPPSLAELGRLADEIWYLAGDTSVDASWYTKRGLLSGVYAATETFMSQDQSTNFKDTEKFLDRRLEDVRVVGQGASDVAQFIGFAGINTVNVLRSWGAKI